MGFEDDAGEEGGQGCVRGQLSGRERERGYGGSNEEKDIPLATDFSDL